MRSLTLWFDSGQRRPFINEPASLSTDGSCALRCTTIHPIDADSFKKSSDAHGLAGGDAVLMVTAALLNRAIRKPDAVIPVADKQLHYSKAAGRTRLSHD